MTTLTTSSNLQTLQHLYDLFGRGDIPALMNLLPENVVFEHNGDLPWSGRFEGLAGAGTFFQAIGANVQVTGFQPSNFREEGNKVVNDARFEGLALSTGKSFGYDLLMTWTFDDDGKPIHYIGSADVSQLPQAEAAFRN